MKEFKLLNVTDMFDILNSYVNCLIIIFLRILIILIISIIIKSCHVLFTSRAPAPTLAESSLVFQLVKFKKNISVNYTFILKNIERSHSHSGFSTYV